MWLAAALWQNPHVLFLDEPTNHLDRDDFFFGRLGSGNPGFQRCCDGVAAEKWIMKGGLLRIEEESVDAFDQNIDGNRGPDEVFKGESAIEGGQVRCATAQGIRQQRLKTTHQGGFGHWR